jgi:putative restriction endonuclease
MIGHINPMTATLFEKAAMDNGFDRELAHESDWLGFASTHAPLKVWLTALSDELYLVAFSQAHVAHALEDHGAKLASPLPNGAAAGRTVTTIQQLDRMLRRAFQLSRSLPDELLHVFQEKKAALPETTEAERLVVQRVGQDIFRNGLLDYWEGRCAITGLAVKNG